MSGSECLRGRSAVGTKQASHTHTHKDERKNGDKETDERNIDVGHFVICSSNVIAWGRVTRPSIYKTNGKLQSPRMRCNRVNSNTIEFEYWNQTHSARRTMNRWRHFFLDISEKPTHGLSSVRCEWWNFTRPEHKSIYLIYLSTNWSVWSPLSSPSWTTYIRCIHSAFSLLLFPFFLHLIVLVARWWMATQP